MAGLLDFLNTPAGLGLLSGVAGYATGARRGTPVNNIGRGLVTGLSGYATAQDQTKQYAETTLTQQYKKMQMDQMQRTLDQQKAQDAWKAGLPGVMAPKLTGTTQQGQMLADQNAGFGQEGVQSLADSAQYAGQNAPLGVNYGVDKQAVQDYMMQPASPYADKIIENQLIPKPDKYQAVGDTLLKIGGDGGVNPVYSGPKKAPEGMQYDASGNLVEIPGYVSMRQKIAAAGRAPAQPAQPYYSPVQTANGVMAFNARTGRMEPVMVNGQTVVGSQSDPTLQGGIARAKTAGKSMGEAQGTLAAAQGAMPQIEDTVKQLKQIGKDATYTYAGQARDAVARQIGIATPGAVAREKYIQTVRDVLFPQLRATFGAQFTVKEGEALVATLGDPNKTPAERNAALDSFLEQKKMHIQSLQRQTGQHAAPSKASSNALPDGWSVQEHQ